MAIAALIRHRWRAPARRQRSMMAWLSYEAWALCAQLPRQPASPHLAQRRWSISRESLCLRRISSRSSSSSSFSRRPLLPTWLLLALQPSLSPSSSPSSSRSPQPSPQPSSQPSRQPFSSPSQRPSSPSASRVFAPIELRRHLLRANSQGAMTRFVSWSTSRRVDWREAYQRPYGNAGKMSSEHSRHETDRHRCAA